MSFVHLHTHTEYSLLDGLTKVKELVGRAVELEMPAVAITDHGTMFGVAEFYAEAKKKGVKPILGCEVYVAEDSRHDKAKNRRMNHLILLAKNHTGYMNLCRIVSEAYISGFYYKPRIDLDLLKENSEGLIGLSACLKGKVSECILNNELDKARESARKYEDILGKGNFFLELQDHGLPEDSIVNPEMLKIARELDIPPVATNDIHYLKKEDSKAHEVLLCIQTNRQLDDPQRMKYKEEEFYMRSREEMEVRFGFCPEALDNTLKIAEMCDVELPTELMLPDFAVPEGYNLDTYLEKLTRDSLEKKIEEGILDDRYSSDHYRDRLNYELGVLQEMGFPGYFLITWDFINYSKENDIPVGPGRGSAAGSLVSYCLGITDVDPLKYDLLFERFLNPERKSMPDIDIDFCKNRREEVINYVKEKYGKEKVAQIVTYNKMKGKSAIKDVARVLGYEAQEANKITTKLYPPGLGVDIKKALSESEDLRQYKNANERNRELFDFAEKIEGTARHAGVHAAGVIIAPKPITELAPVFVEPNSKSPIPVVQYDKDHAEGIGLLKMDFLGLKTLTIIDVAIKLIVSRSDTSKKEILKGFNAHSDQKVFELFRQGDTQAIFQFESAGMQTLLKKMKPDKIEDLIACNAMYRPGPINSGMLDLYIRRRSGQERVEYAFPELEKILSETYGIIIYQEQVMQIAVTIGGYSLGQADLLRKAMGKKKADVMEKQKIVFLEGAEKNGFDIEEARKLFDLMAGFAEYGFNKSHSAAYAILAYHTAWLRVYFPAEFATAVLTMEQESSSSVDDILKFKPMVERMNIKLLPPEINRSGKSFTIVEEGILFGLGAVKAVGGAAIDIIVEERENKGRYEDFEDFLSRVDLRKVNKKVVESLIASGALDVFNSTRKSLTDNLEMSLKEAAKLAEEKKIGLRNTFMLMPVEEEVVEKAEVELEEWSKSDLLEKEAEVLGFYASGHPLDEVAKELKRFSNTNCLALKTLAEQNVETTDERDYKQKQADMMKVTLGGILRGVNFRNDKRGRKMAMFQLEDLTGRVSGVVFSSLFPDDMRPGKGIQNIHNILVEGNWVFVEGNVDLTRAVPSILINNILPFNEFIKEGAHTIVIDIDSTDNTSFLKEHLSQYKGDDLKIFFRIGLKEEEVLIRPRENYRLSTEVLDGEVISRLGFSYTFH